MNLDLAGRACVVTGGSRGIGLAIARGLCAEGADVLVAARDEEVLAQAREACAQEGGGRVRTLALDVTETGAGEAAVRACEEAFGRIDVLVNNAGGTRLRALDEIDESEWSQLLELNVMAPLRLMRAAVPAMLERGFGRIVNVCSAAGKMPTQTNPAYSVSKAAEIALSRVYADFYAPRGVVVNAVAPGPIEGPLVTGPGGIMDQLAERNSITRGEMLERFKTRVPLARFGTTDEAALAAIVLCSPRAGFVSGATWSVDGGFTSNLF